MGRASLCHNLIWQNLLAHVVVLPLHLARGVWGAAATCVAVRRRHRWTDEPESNSEVPAWPIPEHVVKSFSVVKKPGL